MTLYEKISRSILAIFGGTEWTSNGVKTVPENFVLNDDALDEFVRLHVIVSGYGPNIVSKSGMLMVDIFTPAGTGPSRAFVIAGLLDSVLASKSFASNGISTQFKQSSAALLGRDSANPALHQTQYSIPFVSSGVF